MHLNSESACVGYRIEKTSVFTPSVYATIIGRIAMAVAREGRAPKTVFLAINSARGDDRAVDRALQLALQWKASLRVLHVIDDRMRERSHHQHYSDETFDEISWELSQNPLANDLETALQVIAGDPASQIITESQLSKADVIVMGVGHQGDLERKLFGDTVDRVLRAATVPVLSVRSRTFSDYESILVPTDFSPPARRALDTALAFYPGRSLSVLHVSDVELTTMSDDETASLKAQLKGRLHDMLEEAMAQTADGLNPNATTALEFGIPVDVVKRYVADHRPHLVAIGTHGRTSVRRAVIGSVAEKLLRILPCDIHAVGSTDKAGQATA
jgi:nucleotide-binding universal stress UspA family protein